MVSFRSPSAQLQGTHCANAKLAVVAFLGVLSGVWFYISLNAYPGLESFLGRKSLDAAGGDFLAFYAAAKATLAGEPAWAFDISYISRISVEATGKEKNLPWAYPPSFTMLLTPLGLLDPGFGLAVWLFVLVVAALAAARLTAGSHWTWLAPFYPGCVLSFACGQNGTVTALLLAMFYRYFERSWLCGAIVGLLSYKPQFLPIPVLLLVLERRWKALGVACATGIGCASISVLLFGLDPWFGFWSALGRQAQFVHAGILPTERMYTLPALLVEIGRSKEATLVTPAMALLASLFCWRAWASGSEVNRALAVTGGALLFTPYGYDYDIAVLLVPLFVALRDTRELTLSQLAFISALVLMPMLTMISLVHLGFQCVGLVLITVCAIMFCKDPWRVPSES